MSQVELKVADIAQAVFANPAVIAYNRLETRSRTADFERSMKAEIRDPMWILARQWQLGEFEGSDCGSPATSQVLYDQRPVDRVLMNGDMRPYDAGQMPLEPLVERETIHCDLLASAKMGVDFISKLNAATLSKYAPKYISTYAFIIDAGDGDANEIMIAIAGRAFDGYTLYISINNGDHEKLLASPLFADTGDAAGLRQLAKDFAASYDARFNRIFPGADTTNHSAWQSNQLEYQFEASMPASDGTQLRLTAEKYHNGRLDWYNFDARHVTTPELFPGEKTDATDFESLDSFLPTPVTFKGIPGTRFWQFDDTRIDFGTINTSATGLLHLMLVEFGLTYSNDWFLLPHTMPVNNICDVKGIVVVDVFGENTLIRPAGSSGDTTWHGWSMFKHSSENGANSGVFYLPPRVGKTLESAPIEKVNFVRDEMAKMAWAIETVAPSRTGIGIPVNGTQQAAPDTSAGGATNTTSAIKYVLGSVMPDNWVPFIPVHVNDMEIALQRARLVSGTTAKGVLLTEIPAPYVINEEEITRAGSIVTRAYKRCRWINGKTMLWIARKKETGRGSSWSGLSFDRVENTISAG